MQTKTHIINSIEIQSQKTKVSKILWLGTVALENGRLYGLGRVCLGAIRVVTVII